MDTILSQLATLLSAKFIVPAVVLLMAKYVPNETLDKFFFELARVIDEGTNKIPVVNVLWEKAIEPWIINGLNVSVNALTRGFRHDNPDGS